MLFVTPVNKKSHEVEQLRTTTVSFPVILFHSKSNQTGINSLNVKYQIGYRYRQISVIKNRNIGVSVFSIGASLIILFSILCCTLWLCICYILICCIVVCFNFFFISFSFTFFCRFTSVFQLCNDPNKTVRNVNEITLCINYTSPNTLLQYTHTVLYQVTVLSTIEITENIPLITEVAVRVDSSFCQL